MATEKQKRVTVDGITTTAHTVTLEPTPQGYHHIASIARAEIKTARETLAWVDKYATWLDLVQGDDDPAEGGELGLERCDIPMLEKALAALCEREHERIVHFELGLTECALATNPRPADEHSPECRAIVDEPAHRALDIRKACPVCKEFTK